MSKVNFEVISLEKANKVGFVVANVKFNDGDKVYTYVRKCYKNKFVIDGTEVIFNENYEVTELNKLYETKGVKKTDTTGLSKTYNKIKNEIEKENIKLPIPNAPKSGEVHHEEYDTIKACLECGLPVYLAGPAGSGKNHTVEQIAKELGWEFYFSNSVQQEYKLTGFIDAGGKYHDTEFYKACTSEKECVFFLDEMDASIPEVLVLLNAAIANGYFEFPTGRVDFKHVHFVAAGNTVGSGADEMYTGRMVLDQATLDRFTIIEFDYSMRIEMAISNNNSDLVSFIHEMRNFAEQNGIRATFSYRCITMVTKLEKTGMDLKKIMKIAVVKGLDKDTINTFYNISSETKYGKALKEIQAA